jgi:hypothetical protein
MTRRPAPHSSWHTRAERVNKAERLLHETFRERDTSREAFMRWRQAASDLHAALAAAYPPGFWEMMRRLPAGDADSVAAAVLFLEADPWFFRSGYLKERILRGLTGLYLSPSIAQRLQQVLVMVVQRRDRREFRRYCRLAGFVALHAPDLIDDLMQLRASADPGVRRRAEWMLAAIEMRPVSPDVQTAHDTWEEQKRAARWSKWAKRDARDPGNLMSAIFAYQGHTRLDDPATAEALGCDVLRLPYLSMFMRPDSRSATFDEDARQVAASARVDPDKLMHLLRTVDGTL